MAHFDNVFAKGTCGLKTCHAVRHRTPRSSVMMQFAFAAYVSPRVFRACSAHCGRWLHVSIPQVKVNSIFDPLYTKQCGEKTVDWLQGGPPPEGARSPP